MKYALRASGVFDVKKAGSDEFTEILVNKCIEKYIESSRGDEKSEEHEEYKKVVDYVVESSIKNC